MEAWYHTSVTNVVLTIRFKIFKDPKATPVPRAKHAFSSLHKNEYLLLSNTGKDLFLTCKYTGKYTLLSITFSERHRKRKAKETMKYYNSNSMTQLQCMVFLTMNEPKVSCKVISIRILQSFPKCSYRKTVLSIYQSAVCLFTSFYPIKFHPLLFK